MANEMKDSLIGAIATLIDGAASLKGLPPILTTADGVRKLIEANSKLILDRKIEAFFSAYEKVSEKIKIEFIKKIKEIDPTFINRVLEVVDKIDSVEKATILGILFEATVLGMVQRSEFRRISFMVDRTYVTDLEILYSYYGIPEMNIHLEDDSNDRHTQKDLMQLYAIGYLLPLETTIDGNSSFGAPEVKYELTYIGEIFMSNALRPYFEARDKSKDLK